MLVEIEKQLDPEAASEERGVGGGGEAESAGSKEEGGAMGDQDAEKAGEDEQIRKTPKYVI